MTIKRRSRPVPRRNKTKRGQERADRTRALVIDETIRCIHEEGFAAASTRHIIDRAGVSWGVIQYHFGDRDGLLTAVLEHSAATLVAALNNLADTAEATTDIAERAESLTSAAWEIIYTPMSTTALEILIATRFMRGTFDMGALEVVTDALSRIIGIIGDDDPNAPGIANLLWASPVGMLVAQMVVSVPLPAEPTRQALSALIRDHLLTPPTGTG